MHVQQAMDLFTIYLPAFSGHCIRQHSRYHCKDQVVRTHVAAAALAKDETFPELVERRPCEPADGGRLRPPSLSPYGRELVEFLYLQLQHVAGQEVCDSASRPTPGHAFLSQDLFVSSGNIIGADRTPGSSHGDDDSRDRLSRRSYAAILVRLDRIPSQDWHLVHDPHHLHAPI